jgi:PTS system beta-glucosides-specific IIC component
MLPITLCVLGPAGSFLGNYIGNGIIAIGAVTGFLGVAIIGATFEFLVISGMHMILITFLFQIFATAGHENFVAVGMAAATYAVAGMCLGILHVGHYTLIPSTNLVGLLAFTGNGVGNLVNGIIGCIISVIVSAVVTYYFGFDKNDPIVKGNMDGSMD